MAEEFVRNTKQVTIGELGSQDLGDLVQGARQGAHGLDVAHTGQLDVEVAELVPVVFASHPDEGREVVRRVVANVLVVGLHGCVDEKVSDLLVNRRHILQGRDERSNILEGSTTHDLGGRVQQESVVQLLDSLGIPIHWSNFCDLGNDVSACLPNLPLFVLGQMVVEREQSLGEDISRDVLRHVGQVLGKSAPDRCLLVEAESLEF